MHGDDSKVQISNLTHVGNFLSCSAESLIYIFEKLICLVVLTESKKIMYLWSGFLFVLTFLVLINYLIRSSSSSCKIRQEQVDIM